MRIRLLVTVGFAFVGQTCLASQDTMLKLEQRAMNIAEELSAGRRIPSLKTVTVTSWRGQSTLPMSKIDFDTLRSELSDCEAVTSRERPVGKSSESKRTVYVNFLCERRRDAKRHASLTFFFDDNEVLEIQLGDKIIIMTVGMPSDNQSSQD